MPLLNYRTTVSVDRTLAEIHKALQRAGARRIMTNYDDAGAASGLAFTVVTDHGERSFLLPVRVAAVVEVLTRDKVERRYRTPEHAERVAWRIMKDWLEAQLAIISTEMVTLEQVMLPYMAAGDGRTMWQLYEAEQLALPAGGPR